MFGYAYGEFDRARFSKFSAELKAEMREIQVNLEKLSGPLSNHRMLLKNGLKVMLNFSSTWSS
ncbi:hypothetical protein ACFS7Z_21865 [Pontibacter toksunensis]|uniref:Uncharacterized protein n=1 Tax=Pontibacter toksunensis TaxID=1332631 RepID=A0ABW6C184_9BACT